jgi:hypothetical protein
MINPVSFPFLSGMPCAAQYDVDERWYRAKIVALPGNRMVEVYYVDYGNQALVVWNQIRKLQARFLRIPAQVNIFFLERCNFIETAFMK